MGAVSGHQLEWPCLGLQHMVDWRGHGSTGCAACLGHLVYLHLRLAQYLLAISSPLEEAK